LQKRSQAKENHPGLWDMACAGHISSGETSLEAALKELKEELGIEFQPQDLQYLFSQKSEFVLQDGQYIDREIHDIYLITKNIPISSFKIQKSEVEDLNYVSISVFCHQVIEKDPRLVPHFSEYLKVIEYLKSCSWC
jgi:isopentenyldiphosphate isomerase